MTMASASGALYAAFMAFRRKEEEELSSDDFGLSNEEDSTEGDLFNHDTSASLSDQISTDVDVDNVGLEDDFVDGLEGTFEDEEMSDEDLVLKSAKNGSREVKESPNGTSNFNNLTDRTPNGEDTTLLLKDLNKLVDESVKISISNDGEIICTKTGKKPKKPKNQNHLERN